MQKINSEILERKITFLFFENPKRTFNVKQIKYFIGAKINDQEFFKILFSIARKGYIVDGGRGKYTYNKNKKYLVGKISRRVKHLIDLDTSTEFKISKKKRQDCYKTTLCTTGLIRKIK